MGQTLLDRVDGLTGVITDHLGEMDENRRLSDEVVTAVRDTGLNRSLVPAALGGDDRHLLEVLEAIERISAVDGSTGWCSAISSGSNLFSGYIAPEVAADIWSDPDQGSAGMFGPFGNVRPNGDGLVLTGRWPFCSNSLHSKWMGVGSFWWNADDEAEPIPRLVFVPIDEMTIEPTWDAPGLCGTGSHHASVDSVPVQRERSLTFIDPAWADGPLWRLPLFCILAPVLGVTPLGMARGAIDDVRAAIEGRVGGTRGTLAEDPVGLADFATADAALRAARAGLVDACARAWESAERGDRVPKPVQAEVMMAVNYGCEVAVDVTATAHRLGGGGAAYAGSSLLRRLRDVETARQHIMFGQSHRPLFAKALAGEDLFAPPFIV